MTASEAKGYEDNEDHIGKQREIHRDPTTALSPQRFSIFTLAWDILEVRVSDVENLSDQRTYPRAYWYLSIAASPKKSPLRERIAIEANGNASYKQRVSLFFTHFTFAGEIYRLKSKQT